MTRIDGIRARATLAGERFEAALLLAAPRWNDLVFLEDPGAPLPGQRSAWSARDIAEHVLSVDRVNMAAAARAAQERVVVDLRTHMRALPDWDWENRSYEWVSFDASGAAIEELQRRRIEREALLDALQEEALGLEAGMGPAPLQYLHNRGVEVDNNVEGLFIFCSEHMLDHAEQVEAVLGAGAGAG